VTWISRLSAVLIIAALFGVGYWQFRRRLRELGEMYRGGPAAASSQL